MELVQLYLHPELLGQQRRRLPDDEALDGRDVEGGYEEYYKRKRC